MTNKEYVEVILNNVNERCLNGSGVYAYLAGYNPRLTIGRCFDIVQEARDEYIKRSDCND